MPVIEKSVFRNLTLQPKDREMISIHKNTLLIWIGLLTLLPALFSQVHADQVHFDISFDRSVGIVPAEGKRSISKIGDSVGLNKKGRLWLTGNETKEGFVEIVCQNLSTDSVIVELNNEQSPWLNIARPEGCNNWENDLLICPVGELEKGVFCKISERATLSSSGDAPKLLSASVNIRSINFQDGQESGMNAQQYLQNRVEFYAAGINLCGIIYNKTSDIFINWIIYDGGTVDEVKIDGKTLPEDNEVADCIAEHIPLWKFPEWENDSQISFQF